jgi:transcription-repair coupling factor (superfamily II helicase)
MSRQPQRKRNKGSMVLALCWLQHPSKIITAFSPSSRFFRPRSLEQRGPQWTGLPYTRALFSTIADREEDDPPTLSSSISSSSSTTSSTNNKFQITAPFSPTGDQPQAIQQLVQQVRQGDKYSILRGCTGTGKTLVMAHAICQLGRPALVLCHNKTLAAQLARELRACFSKNHVQLFVSYYNYYLPESYQETSGRYTAKKSSINDELDALRHQATRALVQHQDVVVVSSVSCIYGLGSK